jgi:hypothetical protein
MVRNKTSIIVKDKAFRAIGEEKNTLPTNNFPSQDQEEYHNCRILLSDNNYDRQSCNDYL